MAFASSVPPIPNSLLGVFDSRSDLVPESRPFGGVKADSEQNNHTLSGHAHVQQHEGDDNVLSASLSELSSRTAHNAAQSGREAGASTLSEFPSSPSLWNDSPTLRSLPPYYNREYYPPLVQLSLTETLDPSVPNQKPELASPLSLTSISKTAVASPHPEKHGIHSSIFKLERFHLAPVFKNSGSVARDHLANERTFLSYVRTSLALAGVGVGLVQLTTTTDLSSKSTGSPLPGAYRSVTSMGIMMLVLAFIVLLLGVYRYFSIQIALPKDKFPAARLSIVFIAFAFGAFVAVIFGALLKERVA